MTAEREQAAREIFKTNPERARQILIDGALHFVVSVAKYYYNGHSSLSDLINEGNYGLIVAANKFNPNAQNKFLSYAVWWIRQAILQYIENNDRIIYCPRRNSKFAQNIENERAKNPYLTDDELKSILKISDSELSLANEAMFSIFEIDRPVSDEDENGFILVGDMDADKNVEKSFTKTQIKKAFKVLTEREKQAIILRYGLNDGYPQHFRDIGMALKMSHQNAQNVVLRALKKMRACLTSESVVCQL